MGRSPYPGKRASPPFMGMRMESIVVRRGIWKRVVVQTGMAALLAVIEILSCDGSFGL